MAEREAVERETNSSYGVSAEAEARPETRGTEVSEKIVEKASAWEKAEEEEDDLDIPPSLRARLRGKK